MMARIGFAATLLVTSLFCLGAPAPTVAQYGAPNVRAIRKPTGTSCRVVRTVVETQPDAACPTSGARAYEVDELECSHFRDGNLDRFYTKHEERAKGCVEPEGAG